MQADAAKCAYLDRENTFTVVIFRCTRNIVKSDYWIYSVCVPVSPYVYPPSAQNNSAPTGQIFMKCDIWVFFKNMPRKFKFR
jgi:hypothetical protein